jgi:hypothetical protein
MYLTIRPGEQLNESSPYASEWVKHKAAYKIPKQDVKDQKEEIGFIAYLAGWAGSPGLVELQGESPGEGVRNGGDDVGTPEKTGYHQKNESKDDLEKTWPQDRFHGRPCRFTTDSHSSQRDAL